MKKTLIAVLAAVALLFAESYQVNTLSAKQMGMAHTGAGIKLGSESMNFNPGGLGFLNKTLDVSAGAAIIIPEVEFKGKYGKTINSKIEIPFYAYAASSITDWLSAGLSFTTPYGNSADYGKSWEGAGILQDMSLAVYALQPTVAFKPISRLSIGAGPVIYFGSFELNRRLSLPGNNNTPPLASGAFSGDADVAVAVNAGALYDVIKDKLAFGIGFRSPSKIKVSEGKTEVIYTIPSKDPNVIIGTIGAIKDELPTYENGSFKVEFPLPANLNAGVSFRPMDNLLLAFDWQFVLWSVYDELAMTFTENVKKIWYLNISGVAIPIPFHYTEPASIKKYHNASAFRLGAQYTVIDQLDARLGAYYDQSPVDDKYLTPESPSTDKLGFTTGVSYRPMSGLSIDASLLFATSLGSRSATSNELEGRYTAMVLAPSVGLSYSF